MAFFDLNIPYTESTKLNPNSKSNSTNKQTRLKLAVKAMELGYTGIAYNRTITGTMSELDRNSISLFPISSVLKHSPSISTAVNLHRSVLKVPITTPFRQYTRITVVVDSPAHGAALNSGNPVIKTYDIVAVRPLKQDSFEQACKNYEVDIIAIDFSENRFRLKQPLIKAAIERGVYFEITYSGLVMDAQLRTKMIANAKLLVDWTRGKNIIFSSAAPSVTELRGPYDVANLACLIGFSLERAKASVSKTCRSLLESALRKKKFHKEAIRIELISPSEQSDGFDDWLKWDPISSGEGDLQLDDMAKSFAASSKEAKTVKAIDFSSIISQLPSHGLHIKDIVSESKSEPDGSSRDSAPVTVIEKSTVYDKLIDCKLNDPSLHNQTSVMQTPENEKLEVIASVEGGETCDMIIEEETKISSNSNTCFSFPEVEQQNLQEKVREAISEANDVNENGGANTCNTLSTTGMTISFDDNISSNLQCEEANNLSSNAPICPVAIASSEADTVLSFEASLCEEALEKEEMRDTKDICVAPMSSSLPLSGESLIENVPEEPMSVMGEDVSCGTLRSHDELQNGESLIENVPEEPTSVIGEVVSFATKRSPEELQNGESLIENVPKEPTSVIVEVVSFATKRSPDELQNGESLIENVPEEPMSLIGDDVSFATLRSHDELQNGESLIENVPEEPMSVIGEDVSFATLRSHDELQIGASSVVLEPLEDVSMEVEEKFNDHIQMNTLHAHKSPSERVGRKHGISRRSVSFPFKRLLKPSRFKKVRKPKTKGTILSLDELIG